MPRNPSEIRAEMEGLLEELLTRNAAGEIVGGLLPTDPERWEELQAEINETINRVGRMIAALRRPVEAKTLPLREELARVRQTNPARAADLRRKIEAEGGWFADWRTWLMTLDEDDRAGEVEALTEVPPGERKAFVLDRIQEDTLTELRRARIAEWEEMRADG